MDMMDEVLLRFEALKEEFGGLAGVYCHIANMTFVDSQREADILRTIKHMAMQQMVYEYVEAKGYVQNPNGDWVKERGK